MSRNTYLICSILAILVSTSFNYSSVGSSNSGSRSYHGSRVGGGSSSSGWHK
ncbi:hypothetical protein H9Q10_01155 [Eikenella sp. S3360]|uniref:Uncharacterized protein n=1 Tax=Eikenella glucosivorans TaxID=2766967 RepID=A0ABS0N7K8_9NEIS|nr:hypothetical protein [Eikenella glucosivorans]MBH5328281.1 hypothetical protein [Eikenella glucosivorans]